MGVAMLIALILMGGGHTHPLDYSFLVPHTV